MKIVYFIFSIIFLIYLALPNYDYPIPPGDALDSKEPADTETPLRRAYFTDFDRERIINHYQNQLEKSHYLDLALPTFRLNYPPEDSQVLIRDQTRSTFLEEIVHPLRESFFINGFEAKSEKDTIFIAGKVWLFKITTRLVQSNIFARIFIGLSILVLIPIILRNWISIIFSLRKEITQKWNFR